jgi:hypothetical protein
MPCHVVADVVLRTDTLEDRLSEVILMCFVMFLKNIANLPDDGIRVLCQGDPNSEDALFYREKFTEATRDLYNKKDSHELH